jgi:predicted glycosyltransferase
VNERPTLLFYCQHSVGLGHLVRSLALADALAEHFDVVLLNGGRLPPHTRVPAGVEVVNLPPLGHDEQYELVSHDPRIGVEAAQLIRRGMLLDALAVHRPVVVLLELFPFGRKKFACELDPLLAAIAALGPQRPKVVCSLRDILVNQRRDQARHDDRASRRANAHLDAILVHTDPSFARLEESFRPATPLRVPVYYTGFVTGRRSQRPAAPRQRRVLVSAGGGMVGEPLFRAAADAHWQVWERTGLTTTVVAGPFLPDPAWTWLQDAAAASPLLTAVRQVDDLAGEIAASAVSLSQCGYNTTMDLLRAGTPSVVVPYAEGKEDEQRRRAVRLETLGLVTSLDAELLGGGAIAVAVARAVHRTPPPVTLDLDGSAASTRVVAALAGVALHADRART